MIRLHRIGRHEEFLVNPDLLVSLEATPDTIVVLATGNRMVVEETPEQVAEAVRSWRASVLAAGLALDALSAASGR